MGKKRKTRKRPMETSKLILLIVAIVNAVVILFTLVMVWITQDLSPLTYLIPAVAAEAAAGTGFYYNKAKEENRIKLMAKYGMKPTEQVFNSEGGYYDEHADG